MIQLNANLDLSSGLKINVLPVEELISNLTKEELLVTFFARKEEFKPKASRGKDRHFLRVILPYEEVLNTDDTVPLMLQHLAKNVERLKWLDHVALKEKIESVLEAQTTSEAKAKRLERAAKWAADRQVQIDHIEQVAKFGTSFPVHHKEPDDYPEPPVLGEE